LTALHGNGTRTAPVVVKKMALKKL